MSTVTDAVAFGEFVAGVIPELVDIFDHVEAQQTDPEAELQLALSLIRKAKNAQAKKEIEGR